jgi:hypothetical protein
MKLPQLALRDLFWLVLVAALVCAWWLDHRSLAAQIQDLQDAIFRISPARPSSDLDL